MPWAASDLDFAIVDRARTLGDMLKLLFAMLEAFGPKDVADLLTEFDGLVVVDPETAGRWLRNERRPSKPHLRLIVRLFQSRGLIGSPPARDRLFMRIAACYAKLNEPDFSPLIAPARRPAERRPYPGERFRALREEYELAIALALDLEAPGSKTTNLDVRSRRPRPFKWFASEDEVKVAQLIPTVQLPQIVQPYRVLPALSRWDRIIGGLRSMLKLK